MDSTTDRRRVSANHQHADDLDILDVRNSHDSPIAADVFDLECSRIAVLIPCRDEEITIERVVHGFQRSLPTADIYVYDNGSSDRTAERAIAAGAVVRREPRPGKGNVVRRMFSEIDADIYVMADGDATYDATAAPRLVRRLLEDRLDMVVGRREEVGDLSTYRRGHRLGNSILTGVVQSLFGEGSRDMLSGYRALSRRYVKSFPATSCGFEIETEMTVHALDLNLPFDEVPTLYCERPSDSHSKLRTIPDGAKILAYITLLLKEYRPSLFFGALAALCATIAVIARTALAGVLSGISTDAPSFVGNAFVVMLVIFAVSGLVLDSTSRSRRETRRLAYLASSSGTRSASEEDRRSRDPYSISNR
jgi:hypothetical protein